MKKVQNSGESANTIGEKVGRKMQKYKLVFRRKMQIQGVNPGERCKNTVGHSGERQYNRAKVGKWAVMAGKKIISWSEEKTKKDANTMKRSSGVRKRIRAKDAKYRSRGQARGGKDEGFGEQKGKIQSCQAMQIQLQAPIQAIQHQASPGDPGCA